MLNCLGNRLLYKTVINVSASFVRYTVKTVYKFTFLPVFNFPKLFFLYNDETKTKKKNEKNGQSLFYHFIVLQVYCCKIIVQSLQSNRFIVGFYLCRCKLGSGFNCTCMNPINYKFRYKVYEQIAYKTYYILTLRNNQILF